MSRGCDIVQSFDELWTARRVLNFEFSTRHGAGEDGRQNFVFPFPPPSMRALPRLAWIGLLCVAACVTAPVRASYFTKSSTPSAEGWIASLGLSSAGPYPGDVTNLLLNVFYETDQRIRFRLTPSDGPVDLTFSELPDSMLAAPTPATGATASRAYNVLVSEQGTPFAITVVRADSGVPVWQTTDSAASPMVFAQQFLSVSNQLPMTDPYVFGLGERDANLRMRFDTPYVLFSQDVAPINSTLNQYGMLLSRAR